MNFIKVTEKKQTNTEVMIEISLNRPEVKNAFHPGMIAELTKAFCDFSQREDIKLITLCGEGNSFCAGADLHWMKSVVSYSLEENKVDAQKLCEMFTEISKCPHVIMAKVHGHVMGGAVGLLAVCDIVAAEENTIFCFSEVKLGLVPAVISPFVTKKMLTSKVYELMLTARRFDSLEAKESGLIHFLGSQGEVEEFFLKTVKNIMMNGIQAMRETKKLLCFLEQNLNKSVFDETVRVIAERRVSDEGQKGLRQFLEKRKTNE